VKNDIVDSLKLLGIGFHLYVDKRNRFEIRVSSKPLYTLFIEIWGLGRRSGDKKLPTFAFYANDDFIRGLLSALFAGDVGPSPTALEYSTKSRTLALQISLLLSRFNIHTKIYQQQIGNPNATYWRVAIIASTNFKRLLPLLSSTSPHILSHSLKIALEVRGRDDQLENVPAREIISNSQALMDHDFYVAWQNATRISRDKMKTLAKLIHDVELERRLSSPVGFLKVIQLNEAGEDYVFNLKTNFGNYFTAQGLLVSNCDSLLRHRAHWMRDISLVVADEVHLLNDLDRGPTLEVVLARLLQINPDAQFLALSATIRNAEEIAEWLKAKSITTEWRPVKLKEGVYLHGEVEFKDGSSYKVEEAYKNPAINMVARILKQRGQALIFAETRKASVELATKVSLVVKNFLSKPEERSLKEVSTRILGTGERTRISKLLAELITRGTAFHHAGLYGPHRKIVEDSFRAGKIKVVVATPTLAAGVNLPARLVVINSYERFEPGYGRYPIPVLEYKQMAGRAGRPKYDKIGEAILIARTPDEQEYLMENYICAQPERIWSRLAVERVLRSHVLATLASGFAHTEQGLYDFFDKTFYAFQYDPKHIRGIVGRALKFLADEEMVHFDRGNIVATEFGRRVSELYIDPESAVIIRDGLYNRAKVLTDISFLHMICHTPDMAPKFYPRRKELKELELYFDQHREELMFPIPDEWTDRIAFEEYLAELKGTRVLECWINEMSEDDIIERYAVEPGDLFRFVENANWLLYASHELAQLFHHKDLLKTISVLRERVVDGVKSELLPLVRLEGIGRVRARLLYNAGFRTIDDLKKASISQLTGVPLIGLQIAKKIKDQVGGLIKLEDLKRLKTERGEEQASLTDYK
jgi:helicase